MYILKLEAINDSDENYDIVIAAHEDVSYICRVRDALNDFCCKLPNLNNVWVTMDKDLDSATAEKDFNDCVLPLMDYDKAQKLFARIKDVCNNNTVYIYSTSFSLEEVVSI